MRKTSKRVGKSERGTQTQTVRQSQIDADNSLTGTVG